MLGRVPGNGRSGDAKRPNTSGFGMPKALRRIDKEATDEEQVQHCLEMVPRRLQGRPFKTWIKR